MRIFFFLVFLVAASAINAQVFNDTVFYKSGLERPCEVLSFDQQNVQISYKTQKGEIVESFITDNKMKYFVVYDSLGTFVYSSKSGEVNGDTSFIKPLPDSMTVAPLMLSVNPFSTALLGINLDYTVRFGSNMQYAIHFPLRLVSPILAQGFFLYTGIGFKAFVVNKEKFSMTLAATPSFYLLDFEDAAVALPLSIGFVRYFTPRIALDGYLGAGPGFINGHVFTAPIAHIGVAFLMGERTRIKTSK